MKQFPWPYPHISREDFLDAITLAERILQKYGAAYVREMLETGFWTMSDGGSAYEPIHKRVWRLCRNYIRVDRIYFPEKPFLVLEFSETLDGPYEDADPFPYDLPPSEMEQEILISLRSGKG